MSLFLMLFLNRFSSAPRGLKHILESFCLNANENAEAGRRRLYKRLFGILWVSILIILLYLASKFYFKRTIER